MKFTITVPFAIIILVCLALVFAKESPGVVPLPAITPPATAQPAVAPPVVRPPDSLYGVNHNLDCDLSIPGYYAEVSYDTEARVVSVKWSLDSGEAIAGYQDISCTYWPTATALGPNGELLICGKQLDGDTIIESLILSSTTVVVVAGGGATPPYSRVFPQGIQTRSILWQSTSVDFDMARDITCFSGDANGVYAYSYDPPQIIRIDRLSGVLTVLAGVAASAGTLAVPQLVDGKYMTIWYREHSVMGGVLVVKPHNRELDKPLVLFDGDMDGSFDNYFEPDSSIWVSLGLHDEALYVD